MRGTAAQKYFRTGKYIGNGVDNRNITSSSIGFTPDIVIARGNVAATNAVLTTSSMGADSTAKFDSSANSADLVQSLISNGFQIGANASINTSGSDYFFAAMKSLSGAIAVGTFPGNGANNRTISGVGFQPDVVIIKNSVTAVQARILTSSMVAGGENSAFVGTTASNANGIKSFNSDGFVVGTDDSVNKSGVAMYWIAFKAGNFNCPLSRISL
jgi:hypothetical protein